VLLSVILVGCTPKRVVRDADFSPAPPAAAEVPTPEPDMPAPVPRGATGAAPRQAPAAGRQLGYEAATMARAQLGKPYQWGAQGPDRFDCSGLVCHVYGSLGVDMPRVSRDQARRGDEVARGKLQPGDLVFFATDGKSINHVGIYIGDDEFVHAPRRHEPVRTDRLDNAYWRQRYRTARRVS
jgi:cell wall-associated NlpC family hydrolase